LARNLYTLLKKVACGAQMAARVRCIAQSTERPGPQLDRATLVGMVEGSLMCQTALFVLPLWKEKIASQMLKFRQLAV
jgi:hypothetical protein